MPRLLRFLLLGVGIVALGVLVVWAQTTHNETVHWNFSRGVASRGVEITPGGGPTFEYNGSPFAGVPNFVNFQGAGVSAAFDGNTLTYTVITGAGGGGGGASVGTLGTLQAANGLGGFGSYAGDGCDVTNTFATGITANGTLVCAAVPVVPLSARPLLTTPSTQVPNGVNLGALAPGLIKSVPIGGVASIQLVPTPGGDLVGTLGAQLVEDKTIKPRVLPLPGNQSPLVFDISTFDLGTVSNLLQDTLIGNPIGTVQPGQWLRLQMFATVNRAITWDTAWTASGVPLPNIVRANTYTIWVFEYNPATGQWICVFDTGFAKTLAAGEGLGWTDTTVTGSTHVLATASGSFVEGNCVKVVAGNLVDAGVTCGGGGGGSTPAGSTGDVQFNTAGVLDADTGNFTYDKITRAVGAQGFNVGVGGLYVEFTDPAGWSGVLMSSGLSNDQNWVLPNESGVLCTQTSGCGSSATATALAANGANCSVAGTFPNGVDASGASENCVTLSAVNAQTTTYQVLAADFDSYKTITVASGTFTITLVASGAQPAAGKYIHVINYGSGVVTIARSGQNLNGGVSSLTLAAASATAPTSARIISDGTNYFASLSGTTGGGGVTDGDKGDITVSASGATYTIDNGVVTYAKMQNVSATDRLLGRDTAGAGVVEEITPAAVKTMLSLDNVDNTSDATKNAAAVTLTNKTIDLASNTVTTTLAQLNTAVSDANLVPEARTVTIAGTANQITASTGAQDLSANRTWTLSIPSSPTLPGTTTGTFSGNLTGNVTGNASTATALAANGANCAVAGTFPNGVDASGVAENCVTLSAVNPQTATYQVLAADFDSYKTITVASGTFTITLVASGAQPAAGKYIRVINYGSGVVTIARSGQNINGGVSSLSLPAGSATAPTDALIESDGTNYFARLYPGAGAGGVTDGDKGDITVSASGATYTIDNGVVTYAKMQNVSATDRLLGRDTAGAGVVEEITPAAVKTMLSLDNVDNTSDATKNAAAVTLTNKTLDVEGTGNAITTVSKVWIPAVACQSGTPFLLWDTPLTAFPTATCATGTNTVKGVADFADGTSLSMQTHLMLPSDWSGTIDARFKWYTTATTGSVVWQLATICVADAETDDPAFNTASTVTDAAKGTTLQTNDATITGLTTTGCAAGELMHLKLLRDSAHASDDLAATASLIGVELTLRRTQ